MSDWDKNINGAYLPQWLWDSGRCGLAHQLGFKSGGTELCPDRFYMRPDSQIEINPDNFYDDFKAGVFLFMTDLKNPINTQLRTNFETRFQATFLTA